MNRVQKAAVIIITLLLVVLGTAYGAGYFYFGSHFLPGTELNEFDVSFKTAAEVQDLLDQKVKSYAIAVEERNGGREKIDARSIGMKYKPGGTVQKLLSGQDRLLWFIPESSFEKTDLGFVLDEKLLEEQISGLDCMQNMSAPTDARILYKEGEGFILIPEKEGSKVDLEQASELIDTAIRRGESSVDISGCYEEPKIRQADLEKKYETLKKFQDVIITYDFGDRTETLDIGKIRDQTGCRREDDGRGCRCQGRAFISCKRPGRLQGDLPSAFRYARKRRSCCHNGDDRPGTCDHRP